MQNVCNAQVFPREQDDKNIEYFFKSHRQVATKMWSKEILVNYNKIIKKIFCTHIIVYIKQIVYFKQTF